MTLTGETAGATLAAASANQRPPSATTWHSLRHIEASSHAHRWAGSQPEVAGRQTAG